MIGEAGEPEACGVIPTCVGGVIPPPITHLMPCYDPEARESDDHFIKGGALLCEFLKQKGQHRSESDMMDLFEAFPQIKEWWIKHKERDARFNRR